MSSYLSYDKGRYSSTASSTYKPSRSSYSTLHSTTTGGTSTVGYSSKSSSLNSSSYVSRPSSTYSTTSSYASNRFSSINTTRTSSRNVTSNNNNNVPDVTSKTIMPSAVVTTSPNLVSDSEPSLEDTSSSEKITRDHFEEALLKETKFRLDHCIKGFDCMCILLQNYANEVIPKLYIEIEKVTYKLNMIQQEYESAMAKNEKLIKEIDSMNDNQKKLIDDHESSKLNLEKILTHKFREELQEQNKVYEIEKTNLLNEFQQKEKKLKENFEEELNTKCNQYLSVLKAKDEQISDLKISHQIELDDLRNLLELKLSNPEENLFQKEIDSLRAVLDMKNAEIHELRSHCRFQEKELEQVPLLVTKLAVVEQKNAEMKEALELKKVAEKRLSQQHVELGQMLEKEKLRSKRLSMDNEQLQYRLKNSILSDSDTNLPLKRHWSEDLNETSAPNSPSLIQIYTENNYSSPEDCSKDIPVTVYTNDGVQKVFVFDSKDSGEIETISNGHQNGPTSISLKNGSQLKQKKKYQRKSVVEENGTDIDKTLITLSSVT